MAQGQGCPRRAAPRTGVKSELTPLQRHGNEVSDRRVVSPSPCSAPPAWLLDSSSARRPRPRTASATRPRTRHAVLTRPIAHAATLLACLPACLPACRLARWYARIVRWLRGWLTDIIYPPSFLPSPLLSSRSLAADLWGNVNERQR